VQRLVDQLGGNQRLLPKGHQGFQAIHELQPGGRIMVGGGGDADSAGAMGERSKCPAVAVASVAGEVVGATGIVTPTGPRCRLAAAPSAASAIASLTFTTQPNTALLVTDNKAQFGSLLGDLTGKTVAASFTLSGLNAGASFIYYREPSCVGTTAYVRYYFETSNADGFNETHYWWSNPVSAALNANGPVSLAPVSLPEATGLTSMATLGTIRPMRLASPPR
jgi:hypothetical protein